MKERTLGDIVMFFSQAVSIPPTEKDYRTLEVSLFDWGGRRRFADVFRVMMICLVYRALPVAFPQYAEQLREILEGAFTRTYERNKVGGKPVPEMLKEFNDLIDMSLKHPFMKMALHGAEVFQRYRVSAMSAEKLNERLELLYAHFSTLGDDVQIVAPKPAKNVLKEADRILREKKK